MNSKLKNTLQNSALLFVSLLIGLLIGEVALRVLPLNLPKMVTSPLNLFEAVDACQPDEELRVALKPNIDKQLTTSDYTIFRTVTDRPAPNGKVASVGFRDSFDDRAPFGLMLGDSFTMGWGVESEDTWPAVVTRQSGRRFYNLGMMGTGPQFAITALQKYGIPYKPKVVVWQFFPNDFKDAADYEEWKLSGEPAEVKHDHSLAERIFSRHSYVYKLYKLLTRPKSSKVAPWQGDGIDYVFAYGWQSELNMEKPEIARGMELMKEHIDRFAQLARLNGFKPLFVAQPYKEQVYYEEFASVAAGEVTPLEDVESSYKALLAYAKSVGLYTFDLAPTLRAHKDEQIFLRIDGHLSPEGSRIAGKAIADYMLKTGILPGVQMDVAESR